MKRLCLLLMVAAPLPVRAQAPPPLAPVRGVPPAAQAQPQTVEALVVEIGHTTFFPRPGVTAAYSMDPAVVQATAAPGGFQLTGTAGGQATVMLVTLGGVKTVNVTVPAPQRRNRFNSSDMTVEGQTVEFGQYQIHYNNSPNEITSEQNLTQIAGDRQIHIQVMNANIFPSGSENPVGFPVLSYEVSKPGHSVTLADKMMDNSDLTMTGMMLRGFHLRAGPWEFHAGITSVTEFQDFLLPSNRYEVAGISRRFQLNPRSALEGNFYYFDTNTSVNTTATPGPIATLLYQYQRNSHIQASAELGIGNGFALAGRISRDTGKQMLQANFHYQSPHVASLDLTELQGRTANAIWQMKVSKRFETEVFGSDTDIEMPADRQQIDTGMINQTWWINKHLGAVGGVTASRFVSVLPAASTVRSDGILAGPELMWRHLGGSFSVQKQHNGGGTPDTTGYQESAQISGGPVSLSGFYNVQHQAPVIEPVQSTQGALQDVLRYQSALAVKPQDLVDFIHQVAVLSNQGYVTPPTIGLASVREQYGTNIDWASGKAGHVSLNGLVNTSEGGTATSMRLVTSGIQWTRMFGEGNLLNAGFSVYRSTSAGPAPLQPIEQITFQHRLNSVPRFLVPGRRGSIEGHVFIDDTFAQDYSAKDPPLADVVVFLDGRRSTHTDKSGYFVFHGVPYGLHRVEADYRDARPFYYTSSSPKTVISGGSADFGISFAQGRMFGKFVNDAGDGMGVTLVVEGRGIHREVTTTGDGRVEIDGLPNGVFTVSPLTSSLPPGYSLANLDPIPVTVTAGQAGHFQFVAQAQRSISGVIQSLDAATGSYKPLGGAEVSLSGTRLTAHTDSQGRYLFRRLPAGSYTVTVICSGKPFSRKVQLASAPDIETGADLMVCGPQATTNKQEASPVRVPHFR